MQHITEMSLPDMIENFVLLSKHGHFKQARQFFGAVLTPYLSVFVVAAEYTNFLLDQGDFRAADEFLTDYTRYGSSLQEDEVRLMQLLLAFTRIHTRGLLREAVRAARHVDDSAEGRVRPIRGSLNHANDDVQVSECSESIRVIGVMSSC